MSLLTLANCLRYRGKAILVSQSIPKKLQEEDQRDLPLRILVLEDMKYQPSRASKLCICIHAHTSDKCH